MIRKLQLCFCWILAVSFTTPCPASVSLVQDVIMGSLEKDTFANLTVPDPVALSPQWWHYFDGDGQELQNRIAKTTERLQALGSTLPSEEEAIAIPLINSIVFNLNLLPTAKKQKVNELLPPHAILSAYSLDQQLEINRKIRKLELEMKNELDELALYKQRVSTTQKHIDSLLVKYLNQKEASAQKLMAGLEVMAQQASLGVAIENVRLHQEKIEFQNNTMGQLKEEQEAARKLLNVSAFNHDQLASELTLAEQELEKRKSELVNVELNSLGALKEGFQDTPTRQFLNQKVLHATAKKTLAWARVAFFQLKYSLVMYLNGMVKESNSQMSENLRSWKEQLEKSSKQVAEWEKGTLREQDRVRQEYATLVQAENNDPKLLRLNQARRQESIDTLSVLQQIDDEIVKVNWLIAEFERSIIDKSSFFEKNWAALKDSVSGVWNGVMNSLNSIIFKINGIPITFLSIFRILFIILVTLGTSILARFAFMTFSRRRGHFSDATLYTFGRLLHYFVLLAGVIFAFLSIGLDFSNLVIIAGALTFGIGLGLQSLTMNFFSGLRILFERKLKIGDHIELPSGHKGKVSDIRVLNTVVCTSDGIEIVVPNSELTSNTLVNCTMNNDYRRLHIPFSVEYGTDKEVVRKVVSAAAKKVPCTVRDPDYGDAEVWMADFDKTSLDFKLVVWVNLKVNSFTESKEADYLWEIESALRENNINIPHKVRWGCQHGY
jgi:potassium-dependent mechanosensitive channel